jgi:uncharacterized protein
MLQIPSDCLSPAVLDALIEEFVTRHGTDLTDADSKSAQVRAKLKSGEVIIVFDEKQETTNIVPKTDKPLEEPEPQREAAREHWTEPEPPRRTSRPEPGERHIEYDEPPPPTDY